MQISGIQSQNAASYNSVNKQQGNDPVIKNAQSQIEELRKQLQELAENKEMDPKTKSDKKQQIQQQISDLNTQIRQRQVELRKEQQAPKQSAEKQAEKEQMEEKTGANAGGFSKTGTNALISAANSVEVSDAVGKINTSLKGQAKVLTAQIKTDAANGADVTAKQAELEKVNKGIQNTSSAQAEALGKADSELKNAADVETEKENVKDKDGDNDNDKEIKVDGMYDKDGNRVEEKEESEFEDEG